MPFKGLFCQGTTQIFLGTSVTIHNKKQMPVPKKEQAFTIYLDFSLVEITKSLFLFRRLFYRSFLWCF